MKVVLLVVSFNSLSNIDDKNEHSCKSIPEL